MSFKQPVVNRRHMKRKMRISRAVGLAALIAVIFVILSISLIQEQVSYTAGEIANEDVFYAGSTTSYVSDILTAAAENEAASAVGQVYVIDSAVTDNILAEIDAYASALLKIVNAGKNGAAALDELRNVLPGDYTDDALYSMLAMGRSEIISQFSVFKELVNAVYTAGVTRADIETARQDIALDINASSITGSQESFFKSLLDEMDLPYNKEYDAAATRAAQDEAMSQVTPVQVTVQSGQKIISRGAEITAEQIEALQAVGMYSDRAGYTPYIGLLAMISLLLLLLYLYLRQYQREVYDKLSSLLMLGVVMVVILVLAKLISLIEFSPNGNVSELIGYLLPIPAAAMLLTVLLDRNIAFISTVILAVFVAIIMDGQFSYALVAICGGTTGIITAAHLNQRSQFVVASVWVTLTNLVVIAVWGLMWGTSYSMIAMGALFGLINGFLSAILAMGILPFLESAFSVTTIIRLLELSNSNNPLLKRLMMEAPGTYNHSILVGNLAEAAADAIGANALLVRVASYYHDIGKLKRPHFYIENQRMGENPHDKLQPALSAAIITSHTVDGGKMLREAHFPQEIIDIIEQHHGSSLVPVFYHKAKELAAEQDDVKEADYRYKGRRPQTKEAALVMLADSVQAAVQALRTDDPRVVEARVREVIKSKLINEEQLQDCPLTFRDLEAIAQSFLMVLSGLNHIRISYPGEEEIAEESAAVQPRELEDKHESVPDDSNGQESR